MGFTNIGVGKHTRESDDISAALQRNVPRSLHWSAQADSAKMKSPDRLEFQESTLVVLSNG